MNDEELISKKEVLELTGISYGQFYRWKRKGLIPEAWFIRKSTFTGQETFLPRAKILERIEKIKSLKDEHSLEELASVLAPELSGRRFSPEEVARMDWISPEVRTFYEACRGESGSYTFQDLLYLTLIERICPELTEEETALVISTLLEHTPRLQAEGEFPWTLVVGRKPLRGLKRSKGSWNTSFCCLYEETCLFDPGLELVVELALQPVLEELKLRLSGIREPHKAESADDADPTR